MVQSTYFDQLVQDLPQTDGIIDVSITVLPPPVFTSFD